MNNLPVKIWGKENLDIYMAEFYRNKISGITYLYLYTTFASK